MLWNIFIKSLNTSENIIKYADDLTIYATLKKSALISTSNGEKTISQTPITDEAAASSEWCKEHGMTLNTSKTKHMLITLRDKITLEQPLEIAKTDIERVTTFKLLGIHLDEHLNFHAHVSTIIDRSHTKCYALLILKRYGVDKTGLLKYYCSVIRPLITYACPSWYPSAAKHDIDRLENIQKKCIKIIFPNTEHYLDRLVEAELPTLELYMNEICSSYSSKVILNSQHRLHQLIPPRQSINRHSTRIENVLIKKHRTQSLYNTVFYKFGN